MLGTDKRGLVPRRLGTGRQTTHRAFAVTSECVDYKAGNMGSLCGIVQQLIIVVALCRDFERLAVTIAKVSNQGKAAPRINANIHAAPSGL
jgi:hypothetical protein